jgi:hypothetical protein
MFTTAHNDENYRIAESLVRTQSRVHPKHESAVFLLYQSVQREKELNRVIEVPLEK